MTASQHSVYLTLGILWQSQAVICASAFSTRLGFPRPPQRLSPQG